VKSATKGAKIDKITEERQFPMDFFCETFNCSISPIYQQIAIKKMNILKKIGQKTQFPPYQGQGLEAKFCGRVYCT
jgi:hypothetical protein